MARASKRSDTSKQRRQASQIEDSTPRRGMAAKRAKQLGYAKVSESGNNKARPKHDRGRGKARSKASSRNGGRKSAN